ncbi:hypothetical protein OROMI_020956 [Orobanche minor]
MGKGGLWDDSVIVKAFENAVSKYKVIHRMSGSNVGEKADTNTEENLPASEADNGSNNFRSDDENLQNDDNLLQTTAKTGETAEFPQIKENLPLEQDSSAKCLGSFNIQSWYSSAPEEYSQLLTKYYELEGQRQQVRQQLNQYNCNYQHPVPGTSTSKEYQASVPQPYDTVTCYCPYGCQNWIVPTNILPASCSGDTCIGKSCNGIPRQGNPIPPEDTDFVKTAMLAAERALSSLTKEANGVKGKQIGTEIGHFAESTESSTDLYVVLNAWYSAGFYTGKSHILIYHVYSETRFMPSGFGQIDYIFRQFSLYVDLTQR